MTKPENYTGIIEHVKQNNLLTLDPFMGPMNLSEIDYFENLNRIAIILFGFNKNTQKIHPIRLAREKYPEFVCLLLIKRSDLNKQQRQIYKSKFHFALILDPAKFFCNSCKYKRFLCAYCGNLFSKRVFENHMEECSIAEKLQIVFPKADSYKFTEHFKLMSCPFKLVCQVLTSLTPNKTVQVIGYMLVGFGPEEDIVFRHTQVGTESVDNFLQDLIQSAKYLLFKQKNEQVPLHLTKEDYEARENATHCAVCGSIFNGNIKNGVAQTHHSHFVKKPEYRDPNIPDEKTFLCSPCNLAIATKNYVPLIMFGCRKTLLNLIIGALRANPNTRVIITPRKNEDVMCLHIPNLIKTFELSNFIEKPLPQLVESFNRDQYSRYFCHFNQRFSRTHGPYFFPSGCFTYNLETQQFPNSPKDFIDLDLSRELTLIEFEQVKQFYNEMKCRNMHDYAKLYLEYRVHGINAVVQSLNYWAIKEFGLAIHHDVSLASYSWSSCMYNTKVSFEYLKNVRITELILKGLIGGISHLSTRHIVSHTPRLGHVVEDKSKRKELLCFDLVAAYGAAMLNPMPIGGFQLLNGPELENFNVYELEKNESVGHFLNVDLIYPSSLKVTTSDFPLCPEKLFIDRYQLAKHHQEIFQNIYNNPNAQHTILTQGPKKGVLLHQCMLLWYLRRGLLLSKLNFVIRFNQTPWLRPFVEKCINLRNKSESKLEKQLSKQILNNIYGKCYGGYDSLSVRFCNNERRSKLLAALPTFYDSKIINEDLSIYYMKRKKRLYDKNIAVALSILQWSHLNYYTKIYQLKDYFGDRLKIAGGEVDSIVAELSDPEGIFLQDMRKLKDLFDFSHLDKSSPLYSTHNAQKIGVFKLEHELALEYIKLKSKNFAIRTLCKKCRIFSNENANDFCDQCSQSCVVTKGIPQGSFCPFSFYKLALLEEHKYVSEYYSLQKKSEGLTLCKMSKTILSVQDFKRVWDPDSINSRPFHHDDVSQDGEEIGS